MLKPAPLRSTGARHSDVLPVRSTGVARRSLTSADKAALVHMRYLILILLCGLLMGCGRSAEGRLDEATKTLAKASSEQERFYALDDAAKESFEVGKIEDARKYAKELLALAQKFQGDWIMAMPFKTVIS